MTSSTARSRSDVYPVQIEVVGLQSLQTGFYRLHHALAVIARRIGIVAGRSVGVFSSARLTLSRMAFDELTQECFARAAGVEIRSVNDVSACLGGRFHRLSVASSLGDPHPRSSPKVIVPSAASETAVRSCLAICIS